MKLFAVVLMSDYKQKPFALCQFLMVIHCYQAIKERTWLCYFFDGFMCLRHEPAVLSTKGILTVRGEWEGRNQFSIIALISTISSYCRLQGCQNSEFNHCKKRIVVTRHCTEDTILECLNLSMAIVRNKSDFLARI